MDTGFGIWNPFLHFLLQEGKDVWPIYWVVGVPLIGCNLSQFPMITASYANHHLQSAYLRVRLGMEVRGNLAKLIINVDSHLIHLFFQHLIPIVGHWPTPPQTSWSVFGGTFRECLTSHGLRAIGGINLTEWPARIYVKEMWYRMWKVSIWKVLWQF